MGSARSIPSPYVPLIKSSPLKITRVKKAFTIGLDSSGIPGYSDCIVHYLRFINFLSERGFSIRSPERINEELLDFCSKIKTGDTVLFYYSGPGGLKDKSTDTFSDGISMYDRMLRTIVETNVTKNCLIVIMTDDGCSQTSFILPNHLKFSSSGVLVTHSQVTDTMKGRHIIKIECKRGTTGIYNQLTRSFLNRLRNAGDGITWGELVDESLSIATTEEGLADKCISIFKRY